MSQIEKVIKQNNKFYISFNQTTLAVFSHGGDFLYKIENIGRGPEDYIILSDFDIYDDKIAILDFKKIIYYDLSGNYKSSHKLNFVAKSFKHISNKNILFHTSEHDYAIYLTDHKFKILTKELAYNQSTDVKKNHPFVMFNDGIIFQYGFSNEYLSYDPIRNQFSTIRLIHHKNSLDNQTEEKLIEQYGDNYSQETSLYTLNCRLTQVNNQLLLDYLHEDHAYWSVYDPPKKESFDISAENLTDDIMFTEGDFMIYSTIHDSDSLFIAPIWPLGISEGLNEYIKNNPDTQKDKQVIEMQKILTSLPNLDNANPFIIEFNFK